MAKSNHGKLKGIIGNAIVLLFSVFALAFMALPYSAVTTTLGNNVSRVEGSSVFEAMGQIADVTDANAKASLVFFLLVAIVACVLIITSIVGIVGAIIGNKKLNMTFINRIVTLVLVALALVAMILAVAYTSSIGGGVGSASITSSVSAGSVLPLVFAILAVIGAFVAPTKKKA